MRRNQLYYLLVGGMVTIAIICGTIALIHKQSNLSYNNSGAGATNMGDNTGSSSSGASSTNDETIEGPWPSCIGMTSNDCITHIKTVVGENEANQITFVVIGENDMVTMDYKYDRVHIRTNTNDIVNVTPRRS